MSGQPPPPVSDPYTELTTEHLMGVVWTRPGLARRDRRLVTLTIAAVTGQQDPLGNHLRASLESGDLSLAGLHERIIHLAHYGGWPAGTTAYAVLVEISHGETALKPTKRTSFSSILKRTVGGLGENKPAEAPRSGLMMHIAS